MMPSMMVIKLIEVPPEFEALLRRLQDKTREEEPAIENVAAPKPELTQKERSSQKRRRSRPRVSLEREEIFDERGASPYELFLQFTETEGFRITNIFWYRQTRGKDRRTYVRRTLVVVLSRIPTDRPASVAKELLDDLFDLLAMSYEFGTIRRETRSRANPFHVDYAVFAHPKWNEKDANVKAVEFRDGGYRTALIQQS